MMVRHDKGNDRKAEAIAIASSHPFKSRAAAARHAADLVQKTPGEFYTVEVVDRWLKDAGWKRSDAVSTE